MAVVPLAERARRTRIERQARTFALERLPRIGVPTSIAAQPAPLDLRLYAGDDFTMVLALTDAAGQPIDLSAATIRAQIREQPWPPGPPPVPGPGPPPPPPPALLGQFIIARGDSEIFLHLSAATSAILPRTSVWDVELVLGGIVTTLASGTITMTPEVTR
ncbi:MAG: hypothetical protein J2P57_08800 [Acidimicrobiaceae bacterium]|nr:hypothetical protein [Acidimicrobiaceae bacterium]